ncbi:hypothetical protein [Lacticaseibacillus hulanensis]|jgi:hypothetical protein|uniref:hypothetical protein n=1 Tax=Lacticaseibacillus hulanensis TaxID=2493111 RepID=UPI000FDB3D3A|nr:hypothetical protein [Lacticaseibacillus hulanensis]
MSAKFFHVASVTQWRKLGGVGRKYVLQLRAEATKLALECLQRRPFGQFNYSLIGKLAWTFNNADVG